MGGGTESFVFSMPLIGKYLILFTTLTFAISTLFSLSFFGERCLAFLIGEKYEEIKNKIKVKIYDLMGRLVFNDELPIKSEHKINLNLIPRHDILKIYYFDSVVIRRKKK